MTISIIIPSYNTIHLLHRCLDSLFASLAKETVSHEVIVVDNASTDGSVEMLTHTYPQVKKILNTKNVGYGKANNMAIKNAKGEYILLLNSDCVVQMGAIEHLLRCAQKHESAATHGRGAFVGGKLFNEDGSEQASCGPFYSLGMVLGMLFLKGDQLRVTRYSPRFVTEVDWVSGACLLGKKNSFVDVGLFDESIFMYMEEIDLLYRAKQKGYRVWFCPDAQFLHTGAASSGHKKEPVVNIYRGLIHFYRSHHSGTSVFLLKLLLRIKAWSVIVVCGIIQRKDIQKLYAKALAVLSEQ